MSDQSSSVSDTNATSVSLIEFEVTDNCVLMRSGFWEPSVRADFYEDIADCWRSQEKLTGAVDECSPLVWFLQGLYEDFQNEYSLQDDDQADDDEDVAQDEAAKLAAFFESMDEYPDEKGLVKWIRHVSKEYFESEIARSVQGWLAEEPRLGFGEEDYIPEWTTAQGAALAYFRNEVDQKTHDLLGIKIVEGEFPSSTYYAAELVKSIDAANEVAMAEGLPFRFKAPS